MYVCIVNVRMYVRMHIATKAQMDSGNYACTQDLNIHFIHNYVIKYSTFA